MKCWPYYVDIILQNYLISWFLRDFVRQQVETNEQQAAIIQQLQDETGVSLN